MFLSRPFASRHLVCGASRCSSFPLPYLASPSVVWSSQPARPRWFSSDSDSPLPSHSSSLSQPDDDESSPEALKAQFLQELLSSDDSPEEDVPYLDVNESFRPEKNYDMSKLDKPLKQKYVREALAGLFPGKSVLEKRKLLDEHAHWQLYPKTIKEWLFDAKAPRGVFDENGEWQPVGEFKHLLPSSEYEASDTFTREAVIPSDLRGHYRFGVTEADLDAIGASEKLRRLLSFEFATTREINAFRKARMVDRWSKFEGDCGNTAVQVASLTLRLNRLTEHLKLHKKDKSTKRRAQKIFHRRRKMMEYLKKKDAPTYYHVLKEYNLGDTVNLKLM